jgi:hypothetical protein
VRGHEFFKPVVPARFADEIVRVPADADEVFTDLATIGAPEFMNGHEANSHEFSEREALRRPSRCDAFTKFSTATWREVTDSTDCTFFLTELANA